MGFLEAYALAAATVLAAVSLMWLLSVPLRDASIIDMFWGPLFVVVAWVLLYAAGEVQIRSYLVTLLVTLWGLRLGFHLITRNLGEGEDSRYRHWRANGGERWWLKTYYRVFLLQGAIALLVATPLIAAFQRPDELGVVNLFGIAVWLTGFLWELLADIQLTRFKADPDNEGRILDTGLWRLSRHPNYFGDAVQWWGLGLIAVEPGTWWALVGPAVMTTVFVTLSNDVIERGMKKRRPNYAAYIENTPPFFPRPGARRGGGAG